MYISDRLIFLELHKTGCTHIARLLAGVARGEQVGKHNQLSRDLIGRRPILGSVRDPWEWYLSLWAFGCDAKGALHSALTLSGSAGLGLKRDPIGLGHRLGFHLSRRAERWRRCYADVSDAGAFREWLCMIHDPRYRHDFKDGYGRSPIGRSAGLLTYRYLKLFCLARGERLDPALGRDSVEAFERTHCFVNHFIRNERLEADLIAALDAIGIALSDEQRTCILSAGRTNASSRRRPAHDYYDGRTAGLVRERDRLIADKFGYRPPAAAGIAGRAAADAVLAAEPGPPPR